MRKSVCGGGQGFNAKIPFAGLRTALLLWGLQLTITITGRSKGGGDKAKGKHALKGYAIQRTQDCWPLVSVSRSWQ